MPEPPLRLRQPVISVPFEHGRLPDGRPGRRGVLGRLIHSQASSVNCYFAS
jgi:hypothetical protein